MIHQRSRNGHPLLLPAGQLIGKEVHPVMKSHSGQRFLSSFSPLFSGNVGVCQRKFHILKRRLPPKKLEVLENKSDLLQSEICQFVSSQTLDFPSIDHKVSACRGVQTADQIHQRRLTGARRSDNGCIISLTHCKINIF